MTIGVKAILIRLAAAAISTQAGAQTPTLGARDPSDPYQSVPASGYESVTSGARSFRPIDPLPWRGVNDRVAPKPEQPQPQQK
jgi:hypothetical protein